MAHDMLPLLASHHVNSSGRKAAPWCHSLQVVHDRSGTHIRMGSPGRDSCGHRVSLPSRPEPQTETVILRTRLFRNINKASITLPEFIAQCDELSEVRGRLFSAFNDCIKSYHRLPVVAPDTLN